jgi:type VII secretion-associated serine protease mycosin
VHPRHRSPSVQVWILGTIVGIILTLLPSPAFAYANIRESQWYLGPLKVSRAHSITKGTGVVVAVVDTGVDQTVPAIAGRVLTGTQFGAPSSPHGTVDTDVNDAHGTGMAAVIAGDGRDNNTVLGISPETKILPVAVGNGLSSKPTDIASGIRWAADNGAKVINVSIAGKGRSEEEESAVAYALSKDIVVVAGAGNIKVSGTAVGSPANSPGALAVSGVGPNGDSWLGTSYGHEVGIAAPAIDIAHPTLPGHSASENVLGTGTSDAAAIVSGTAALVRAKYPSMDAANVINRLIRTAKDQGDPGRDQYFGFGTVRPYEALTAQVAPVRSNPLGEPSADPAGDKESAGMPVTAPNNPNSWWIGPGLVVCGVLLAIAFITALAMVIIMRSRRRKKARIHTTNHALLTLDLLVGHRRPTAHRTGIHCGIDKR